MKRLIVFTLLILGLTAKAQIWPRTVPYTGATSSVNLGANSFSASTIFANTGSITTSFTVAGAFRASSTFTAFGASLFSSTLRANNNFSLGANSSWVSSTQRLGLGTNTPTYALDVIKTTGTFDGIRYNNTNTSALLFIGVGFDPATVNFGMFNAGSTSGFTGSFKPGNQLFIGSTPGEVVIENQDGSGTGQVSIYVGDDDEAFRSWQFFSNNTYSATGAGTLNALGATMIETVQVSGVLTGSATLDFGSTAAGTSSELTITVTGAVNGDPVSLGAPNDSWPSNGVFTARVSADNTVTVRFTNTNLVAALDPASGNFRVTVHKNP